MFAYIKGAFTVKLPTQVVIEANGVGYAVNISLQTFSKIENQSEGRLWTHVQIKDDSHDIFGFFDEDERDVFRMLISVSGIGSNTARIILSSMSSTETKNAILAEDELAFKRVKGVGPKTAKRLIIDLKDKVLKSGTAEIVSSGTLLSNTPRREALSALLALGFNRAEVQKALNKVAGDAELTTEELIKMSLKALSKG
jgi:Holliday junction DNA helicase RuvA